MKKSTENTVKSSKSNFILILKIVGMIFISNILFYFLLYSPSHEVESTWTPPHGHVSYKIKAKLKTSFIPYKEISLTNSSQSLSIQSAILVEQIPLDQAEITATGVLPEYIIMIDSSQIKTLEAYESWIIYPKINKQQLPLKKRHEGKNYEMRY